MRLVLDKIEEYRPGDLKLKQFAGDLANSLKTTYENKIRPVTSGGTAGAGKFGSSFLDSLGLSGLAQDYKAKAEAKEQRRQDKENFTQNFQNYSEAGKTLSADTSRQVGEQLFEDIKSREKELSDLQAEEKKVTEAGYKIDEENLNRQKKIKEELQQMDPTKKSENSMDKSIQQTQVDEGKIESAELTKEQMDVAKKEEGDLTALYTISDDYFKKQEKWNDDVFKMLEAIVAEGLGGGKGGGLLSSAAETAGDLVGSKKGGAAGKLGKVASLGGKFAKIGGGLLAVGTAAYEGYNEYQDADAKVKSGEITEKEGNVEKGKAVGGAAGGAGGALAGAAAGAAIGSVVPVVGTAIGGLIGGAIGYWGGKKAGQAVGGLAVEGYQALSPDGKGKFAGEEIDASKPMSEKQLKAADEIIKNGDKLPPDIQPIYEATKKQSGGLAPAAAATSVAPTATAPDAPTPSTAPPATGGTLRQATTEVQNARDQQQAANSSSSSSTVVNAPVTNVSASGGGTKQSEGPKDTSNKDSTFQRYLDRRYYPARAF